MAEKITIPRSIRSLDRAFKVDQAINHATKDFVIIRFGVATDRICNEIDRWIQEDAVGVNKFARIYTVENNGVPELVTRYGLSDNCTIIFFYKGTVGRRLPTAQIEVEMRQKKMKFRVLAHNICESIRISRNQRPGDRLTNWMHQPNPYSSESYGCGNYDQPNPYSSESYGYGNYDQPNPYSSKSYGYGNYVSSAGKKLRFGNCVSPFDNPLAQTSSECNRSGFYVPSAGENLGYGDYASPVRENLRFVYPPGPMNSGSFEPGCQFSPSAESYGLHSPHGMRVPPCPMSQESIVLGNQSAPSAESYGLHHLHGMHVPPGPMSLECFGLGNQYAPSAESYGLNPLHGMHFLGLHGLHGEHQGYQNKDSKS